MSEEFVSSVPQAGYSWQEHRLCERLIAFEFSPCFALPVMRLYPGLFMTFAAINISEESVASDEMIRFASKYGRLGLRTIQASMHERVSGYAFTGETLRDWVLERIELRSALARWYSLSDSPDSRTARTMTLLSTLSSSQAADPPEWTQGYLTGVQVRHSDTDQHALTDLSQVIERKIAQYGVEFGGLVGSRAGIRFELIPRNLSGAMWLQLANYIQHPRFLKPCAECGLWFEAESSRRDKLFCSQPCTMRAYRRRRSEARRLASEGRSVP